MPLPTHPKDPKPFTHKDQTVRKRSQIQEKRVAKISGGKTQIASGALPFAKGDVKTTRFLVECKTTKQLSYRLERAILEKISNEARAEGRVPAMAITFEACQWGEHSEWALVPLRFFSQIESTMEE